jgi:HlyD family secretion protein
LSDREQPAAAPGERIFRAAALERLNSPERLDQRIAVIPPGMRLLAAATTVIVVAALAWGVFGSIPTRVVGRGVLLSDTEGNFSVASVSTGLVLEMFVKPGDHVLAGQEIASIEQKLLSAQIANAMAQVDRLAANLAKLKAAGEAQVRQSDETAVRQRAAGDEQVAAHEARRDQLQKLVGGYEGLRAKGLISQNEVIARQDQLNQSVLELADARAKRVEIEAAAQKKRDDLAEMERQKQVEIDLKKDEAEQLRVQMTVGSVIKSPISGVVREIRVGRGDVAAAGAVLATVGQEGTDTFEVLALLSGDTRKRVTVGMAAHIAPNGTKKEEYGSMRGRVVSVSEGDVSIEHVEQILQSGQLTKTLFGDTSPLLARIELTPARANPSGFAWWSGSGPPYRITPGTVAAVDIIVEEQRPIALVIPALRKLLSLQGG